MIEYLLLWMLRIRFRGKRKSYLHGNRDEAWEQAARRAYGYPIEIHQEVIIVKTGDIIPCRVRFVDAPSTPTATKGVLHVTPRIPLSFPVGIEVAFNDEVAKVTTPNNAPVSKIEDMLSVRWAFECSLRQTVNCLDSQQGM
jgi:hypothetical protein